MNTDLNTLEMHRLFTAKADGTITPEEHEKLAALLKESAGARSEWFAFQDAESGILAWAQREALRRSEMSTVAPRESGKGGMRQRARLMVLGSMAAGIVVGALALALWPTSTERVSPSGSNIVTRGEATTSAVALLTRGVDLVWESDVAAPALNEPLSPGELKLRSGVAEIEFFQGARLCMEGPATIKLVSAGEAYCSSGRFSAEVPPQARGFRIGTPKGDLVDLGTEFGLDLNAATPELHVFKGEVEWHQPETKTRLFTTGQATELQPSKGSTPLAANPAAFAFSRDLGARTLTSQREAFGKWRQASSACNNDPSLRVRLDFQDEIGSRFLRNAALEGGDIAPGTMVGCSWTQGRWPGKQALQFASISDRVRLNVPGGYKQLTLAASVQLHRLNIRQSSICMSQGMAAGYAHWQILHDGSLCLGVGVNEKPIVWEDYISPVVFTPERFGQWVHLAVVYDTEGGEVRFYANGECLSRHPMKRKVELSPALVELGNWTPSPDKRQQPVRSFAGCMDEFMLFSRALGDDEIRRLPR